MLEMYGAGWDLIGGSEGGFVVHSELVVLSVQCDHCERWGRKSGGPTSTNHAYCSYL